MRRTKVGDMWGCMPHIIKEVGKIVYTRCGTGSVIGASSGTLEVIT